MAMEIHFLIKAWEYNLGLTIYFWADWEI